MPGWNAFIKEAKRKQIFGMEADWSILVAPLYQIKKKIKFRYKTEVPSKKSKKEGRA